MIVIDRSVDQLPPKPDPLTGEPRPPRATVRLASESTRRSTRWARYPEAPKGRGPVLEWFQPTLWDLAVVTGITTSGMFLLGNSLHRGLRWLRSPRAVLLTVGVGVASSAVVIVDSLLPSGRVLADDTASAGADWLAVKDGWVDTYELGEVDVEGDVVPSFVLTDSSGRSVRIGLVTLQANPALWDLVCNGIMHSMRHGDVVSARARAELRLDGSTGHPA